MAFNIVYFGVEKGTWMTRIPGIYKFAGLELKDILFAFLETTWPNIPHDVKNQIKELAAPIKSITTSLNPYPGKEVLK